MAVIAIAPPTMIATIGIRNGPKPRTLSIHSMLSSADAARRPTIRGRGRPRHTKSGGADRDRTGGLLVANQALSQLSYSPKPVVRLWSFVVRKSQRPTTHDQLAGGPG